MKVDQMKCPSISNKEGSYMQHCDGPYGHSGAHSWGTHFWEDAEGTAPVQQQPGMLRVSEVFYSLQGEGARAGEPSIFVRLQGCSARFACYASGVLCDTEFDSGKEMTVAALVELIKRITTVDCNWIVLTGGEPMDQLTPDILKQLRDLGYMIALETSGIKRMEKEMECWLNHITISPKVAEHVLQKNFGHLDRAFGRNVDELRYVRHAGQPGIPQPALKAEYYYLSPHSDGPYINQVNVAHCIELCLANPRWRLSLQQHKLWRIL